MKIDGLPIEHPLSQHFISSTFPLAIFPKPQAHAGLGKGDFIFTSSAYTPDGLMVRVEYYGYRKTIVKWWNICA